MKKNFPQIGVQIPEILIPKPDIDYHKWGVIACDQFTSQPEYWADVESVVGDSPSTLNIILPEVYLGKKDEERHRLEVVESMRRFISSDTFTSYQNLILVERTVDGKTRHGMMLALDLEHYNFNANASSLIRASEGTIIDRLPPRIKIRQEALLETPHILVLIDDPLRTVIEPLVAQKDRFEKIYDFDLMAGSGHLTGFNINQPDVEQRVISAIEKLADPSVFKEKYQLERDLPVLLFAVGDGNHSLATAKSVWEKIKPQVGMDHPARYALVEIENIHNEGLVFEPIHRLIFGVHKDIKKAFQESFGDQVSFSVCSSQSELLKQTALSDSKTHCLGMVTESGYELVKISHSNMNLPVGTLQVFLDKWLSDGGADSIDYIHGHEVVFRLGQQPGNIGFIVPAMVKGDLFKTVILDGALPRKAFSMGEAHEKRFYFECRKIV